MGVLPVLRRNPEFTMAQVIRSRRVWLAIVLCLVTVVTGYAWATRAPNRGDDQWITENGVTFKWRTHNGMTFKLLKDAPEANHKSSYGTLPTPAISSPMLPAEFVSVMSPEPLIPHRLGNGGNVLSMTDPEGQVTAYEFDDLGRIIRTTYPDHVPGSSPGDSGYGITETAYDSLGRIARTTDQSGSTITYVYDMSDRLIRKEYRPLANSPNGAIADQDEMTYDAQGRLLSATSGRYGNTVSRTYDADGRLASESLTIDGQTYTATATYGATSPTMTLTYPDGSVVVKTTDSRGLLTSVTRNGSPIVSRTYTDAGRVATQTFGNGVVESWTWTDDGQVASIENPAGLFTYTYDANNNRTAETITGPLAAASWTTGENGFDDDDRLVYRNQGNGDLVEEWELSLVGDWEQFTRNGVPESRTHGPAHELLTLGSATLSYDSRGNLTTDEQGRILAWDADNRLTSVDGDADTAVDVEYVYDAFSRRVARREWDRTDLMNPVSTTEVYVHWEDDMIADFASGAVPTSPLREYVLGLRIDDLVAMIDRTDSGENAGGTYEPFYYHRDAVTSIRALSDANGNVVEFYQYAAYGDPTILSDALIVQSASAVANRVMFTSREWDWDSRISQFRHRWLSPSTGRFCGRDWLQYTDGANLYSAYFVPGASDPTGLQAVDGRTTQLCDCQDPFLDASPPPPPPDPTLFGSNDQGAIISGGSLGILAEVSRLALPPSAAPGGSCQVETVDLQIAAAGEGVPVGFGCRGAAPVVPLGLVQQLRTVHKTGCAAGESCCSTGRSDIVGPLPVENTPILVPTNKPLCFFQYGVKGTLMRKLDYGSCSEWGCEPCVKR
jgi:RHS repeat-associated protein